MNFQTLNKVENPDFYIDVSFREATKASDLMRMKLLQAKNYGHKISKSRQLEIRKIGVVRKTLSAHLGTILTSFPRIEDLPEFYKELIRCTIGIQELHKSLGAVNWVNKRASLLCSDYEKKMKKSNAIDQINSLRRMFYGRIASVVKQIRNELKFLENARKIMKGYPAIKTSLFSVAIAGFPNVGKSTLLSKLTTAKPEIADYAFTTTGIMMGYSEKNGRKIQFLDTPGTLNRFNKMNSIEKQAYLAIKHVANMIVYVFDFTEPYPLKDQEALLKELQSFEKEIIVYASKEDKLRGDFKFKEFVKSKSAIIAVQEIQSIIERRALEFYKTAHE